MRNLWPAHTDAGGWLTSTTNGVSDGPPPWLGPAARDWTRAATAPAAAFAPYAPGNPVTAAVAAPAMTTTAAATLRRMVRIGRSFQGRRDDPIESARAATTG